MSDEITNNIPEPDPTWDYYITWHRLFKVKNHLDNLIQEIGGIEYASAEVDQSINHDLEKLIQLLKGTFISPPDES